MTQADKVVRDLSDEEVERKVSDKVTCTLSVPIAIYKRESQLGKICPLNTGAKQLQCSRKYISKIEH